VRYPVNIPASIRISSYAGTVPFDFKGATICDIREKGVGVSLTVETTVTSTEFSKMLTRRRACWISCSLPGFKEACQLYGEIAWAEPHATSKGTVMRFGVSLDEGPLTNMAMLKAFLKTIESKRQSQIMK